MKFKYNLVLILVVICQRVFVVSQLCLQFTPNGMILTNELPYGEAVLCCYENHLGGLGIDFELFVDIVKSLVGLDGNVWYPNFGNSFPGDNYTALKFEDVEFLNENNVNFTQSAVVHGNGSFEWKLCDEANHMFCFERPQPS
ncbi:UNVERIFIED_CONTAM: hypothetical protein RMT77_000655 [Armadillidium vulgare]